jgi:hypothetical protein
MVGSWAGITSEQAAGKNPPRTSGRLIVVVVPPVTLTAHPNNPERIEGKRYGDRSARSEIEHMCGQVGRQRKEILQLPHVGIGTASTRLLLERMLAKVEGLCDEHERPQESAGRSNQRDAGWRPLRSFILRVHRHHAAHPQLVFLGSNLITSVPSAFPLLKAPRKDQCVFVSCHVSRSIFASAFRCSFSGLLFHGLSVCLWDDP